MRGFNCACLLYLTTDYILHRQIEVNCTNSGPTWPNVFVTDLLKCRLATSNQFCVSLHVHVKIINSRSVKLVFDHHHNILWNSVNSTVRLGYSTHSNNDRDNIERDHA